MNFLLMDFGTSRIKSALLDTVSGKIHGLTDRLPAPPAVREQGKFEVAPEALQRLFASIVDEYMGKSRIDGICLCTEMHGFVLLDGAGQCLSNYISWQDERENFAVEKMAPAFSAAFPPEDYLARTGMYISSSPAVSLLHVLRGFSGKTVKVAGMPELLAAADGKPLNIAHVSSAAGLGLWNLDGDCPDAEIVEYIERRSGCRISFNQVVSGLQPAGIFKNIPVFCGLGDLQCAVLGAGNNENTVSVNLGTGSQVSWIGRRGCQFERRPLVDGQMMQTVTHIPSGRALNSYIGFLQELAPERDFWKELGTLSVQDISDAEMDFDLNIFHGAWRYRAGGSISRIGERRLTVKSFLSSLLRSYLDQYLEVIGLFAPPIGTEIILSGGIPGRIPAIMGYFSQKSGMTVSRSTEKEETLTGLKKLAGRFAIQQQIS